jgi:hypothetical protein
MIVDKERETELDKIWKKHRRSKWKEKQREIAAKKKAAKEEKAKKIAEDEKLLSYIRQVKNHLKKNILDEDGTPAFWFE